MADLGIGEDAVFLQPGEAIATEAPIRIKTVVGSCLAIVVRAPRIGVTVVAHCLLPRAGAAVGSIPRDEAIRYVDTAIEVMLSDLAARGALPGDLEVKLFGGADAMECQGEPAYRVGRRNIDAARAALASRGLTASAHSVGGKRGRVLEVDAASGVVFVKRLPDQEGS
ncbi:MAG TPA: chemotaxis protein CheD [Bryobacteraceae bacterium]|jgi:chemotaxis protein CheD